jgi:hypothetical protein
MGCKAEGTMLVGENQNKVLTAIPSWLEIVVDGIARPSILVI